MAKTKIEWADEVWNPVTGCTKVSQGCKNCYAERIAERFWGERKFTDIMIHPERMSDPYKWKKPRRVFVNSMSDLFHETIPQRVIDKIFEVMAQNYKHTFLVLTKRPERMIDRVNVVSVAGTIHYPIPNVWLGVSVEDQATADERIPLLLRTPAAARFVSCEPLLGAIDLHLDRITLDSKTSKWLDIQGISWVIVGGESGKGARPMHPDWARGIRDQCVKAGAPFFFKQWGEWSVEYPQGVSMSNRPMTYLDGCTFYRVGKKLAGRVLDGREWNEFPEKEI